MDTDNDDSAHAVLRWSPDAGFELDLDATEGDVSVRLAAVPVPADGTDELASGVDLHKLEIMFKAIVDVDGAPGQLHDARVQVDEGDLVFRATIEDAESGATIAFTVETPVVVPPEAPSAGGPRPRPPEEDELDWEDDETFEQLFGEDRMPTSERAAKRLEPPPDERRPQGGGLAALLRAIAHADQGDLGPDEPSEELPRPTKTPAKKVEATMESNASEAEARSFLEFLIEHEQLALEAGHALDELVGGVAPILTSRRSSEAKAEALSKWLLGNDAVEELFVDDDKLAELIERW